MIRQLVGDCRETLPTLEAGSVQDAKRLAFANYLAYSGRING